MRNHRMRGYGSWCIGWNEGSRKTYQPTKNTSNNGNGCVLVFVVLFALCSFKVAIESGNFWGLVFGLAVLAGFFGAKK